MKTAQSFLKADFPLLLETLDRSSYVSIYSDSEDPRFGNFIRHYMKPEGLSSLLIYISISRNQHIGLVAFGQCGRANPMENGRHRLLRANR